MATLEERIKSQQEFVNALTYQLEGVQDSYNGIANQLDRVLEKHGTELKHLHDLKNQLALSKLREDSIKQLKETN